MRGAARVGLRAPFAALWTAFAALALGAGFAPGSVSAQTVEGVVVDDDTGEAIPGVELVLRNESETAVARAETDADGRFVLVGRASGPHAIEVSRLGYTPLPPQELEVGRETVEVEIRLARSPIGVDPLTVTGRRRDPRHDATLEGARARHEQLPPVGSRRVVFRDEPFFTASMRVRDLLQWFPGRSGCIILYRDGRMEMSREAVAELWLESSTEFWEAVEFYRRWTEAPLHMRDIPPYVYDPAPCSVVALWSREEPPEIGRPLWKRVAYLGGFGVAVWGVIRLLGF